MPRDVTSDLILDSSIETGCEVQFGWSPLINLDQGNISHYIVYMNETNVLNKISEVDQNKILVSYPVSRSSCATHNVSVSAVNQCGREGQRSRNIINFRRQSLGIVVQVIVW